MCDHPLSHPANESPRRRLAGGAFSLLLGAARIACSALLFMILVAGGVYLSGILLTGILHLSRTF